MNSTVSNLDNMGETTGEWLKFMAIIEHDADELPPSFDEAWAMQPHSPVTLRQTLADLRLAYPRPHGLAQGHMRYCACCDDWKLSGAVKCSECGAEWERQ